MSWKAERLDAIPRSGTRSEWIPLRRHFGVSAFGVNAWTGDEGAELIGKHDEKPSGHEELYVVLSGHATFTVDGNEVDAPAGTVVFVADPALERGAVARDDATTILSVGAKPGEAFTVRGWEVNSEVFPLFELGEFERARELLLDGLEREPDAGGILYNLACAESRLGETDAALAHLARAIEIEPGFAEYARTDEDFEPIRADPRFPAA